MRFNKKQHIGTFLKMVLLAENTEQVLVFSLTCYVNKDYGGVKREDVNSSFFFFFKQRNP